MCIELAEPVVPERPAIAVSLIEDREIWRLEEIEKALPDTVLQQRGIPDAKRGDDSLVPLMTTVQISGGPKKQAPTPETLLGALTAQGGIPGSARWFDRLF